MWYWCEKRVFRHQAKSIQRQKANATRVDNEPPFSVVADREEQDSIGPKDNNIQVEIGLQEKMERNPNILNTSKRCGRRWGP
jgi:hypothetical protein